MIRDGIGYYEVVKEIEEDFEGHKEELIRSLKANRREDLPRR